MDVWPKIMLNLFEGCTYTIRMYLVWGYRRAHKYSPSTLLFYHVSIYTLLHLFVHIGIKIVEVQRKFVKNYCNDRRHSRLVSSIRNSKRDSLTRATINFNPMLFYAFLAKFEEQTQDRRSLQTYLLLLFSRTTYNSVRKLLTSFVLHA